MAHQSIIDKTAKIVFVTNIPSEIPEDKFKELLGKIGLVSFKMICDKETGKSRGSAVCEFKDQETALNAVKTLHNFEIAGRQLKADHALNEKTRLEMISIMQSAHNVESSNTEKTPETISKAVASLPPEQMFELLKQMKQCVQNNSLEAKNMLLQNPQLAYALLQALVVMRIVDPQIAFTALSNASTTTSSTTCVSTANSNSDSSISASNMINRVSSNVPASAVDVKFNSKTASVQPSIPPVTTAARTFSNVQPVPPPAPSLPFAIVPPPAPVVHDVDMRPKNAVISRTEPDKIKSAFPNTTDTFKRDPRLLSQPVDAKLINAPRSVNIPSGSTVTAASATSATRTTICPAGVAVTSSVNPSASKPATTSNAADTEKAALIMQVLRLTDAQIAMLPPEQRQSIMLLKEQIAKSTKR